MSETPHTEPTSAADETESSAQPSTESEAIEPAAEPSRTSHAKEPAPAAHASSLSRWLSVAALVLSIIAIAGGVVGYFYLYPHKSASSTPTYTDQQTKEAKKHICEAFKIVDHEAVRHSRMKNPPDGGPIGALSVETSAQLAFYAGGAFLRDRVAQEPATPPDLAKNVNGIASNLEELAIGYLAGAAQFAQDALRQSLDDKIKATIEMCK